MNLLLGHMVVTGEQNYSFGLICLPRDINTQLDTLQNLVSKEIKSVFLVVLSLATFVKKAF